MSEPHVIIELRMRHRKRWLKFKEIIHGCFSYSTTGSVPLAIVVALVCRHKYGLGWQFGGASAFCMTDSRVVTLRSSLKNIHICMYVYVRSQVCIYLCTFRSFLCDDSPICGQSPAEGSLSRKFWQLSRHHKWQVRTTATLWYSMTRVLHSFPGGKTVSLWKGSQVCLLRHC